MVSGLRIFRCPEHFFGGSHLFAHKSPLEAVVAWFEAIKTAQNSPPQILVSNGLLGGPFMPDLLFKLRLEPIVGWFEAIKT